MKVKEVFVARKFNLGNYENMDIRITASVDDNEDAVEALHKVEKVIAEYWKDSKFAVEAMRKEING